jgi:DNA repair protein RecO (recombination protein O)
LNFSLSNILKTEAIVLKGQKFRDSSKILTLFTKNYGKKKFIAKGARDVKSKFIGTLEPFSYVTIVFYQKETRDLQILSQCDLAEPFLKIHNNIEKTYIALAVIELIDKTLHEEEPHPILFDSCIETLKALNESTKNELNFLWHFELKLAGILGFKPHLDRCAICKNEINTGDTALFRMEKGDMVGEECLRNEMKGKGFSLECVRILQKFQNSKVGQIGNIVPSKQAQKEINDFFNIYLNYHFENIGQLKSLVFWETIKVM